MKSVKAWATLEKDGTLFGENDNEAELYTLRKFRRAIFSHPVIICERVELTDVQRMALARYKLTGQWSVDAWDAIAKMMSALGIEEVKNAASK